MSPLFYLICIEITSIFWCFFACWEKFVTLEIQVRLIISMYAYDEFSFCGSGGGGDTWGGNVILSVIEYGRET